MNDIFTAVDLTGIAAFVVAAGVLIIGIALAFKGISLAKRAIGMAGESNDYDYSDYDYDDERRERINREWLESEEGKDYTSSGKSVYDWMKSRGDI